MIVLKKIIFVGVFCSVILLLGIFLADRVVSKSSEHSVYYSTSDIPYNKVGLLLGTSKYLRSGNINLYYKYRIQAALALYKAGKIDFILVSGDNSSKYYDEPTTIQKDLERGGIPKNRIYLDYAGFRTLDSVVRSKKIFGQDRITIISQPFHNERAIFISQHRGITAIGFNTKNLKGRSALKVQIREKMARVKVILDILFGVEPKFLGEKVKIQ